MNSRSFSEIQTDIDSAFAAQHISTSAAKHALLEALRKECDVIEKSADNPFQSFKELFDRILFSTTLNHHRHPHTDKELGIRHTRSLQEAMEIIRNKALAVYEKEFNQLVAEKKYTDAAKLAVAAVNQSIFSLPRGNWFKTFMGMTTAQNKILEMFNKMQDDNPTENLSLSIQPTKVFELKDTRGMPIPGISSSATSNHMPTRRN